MKSNEFNMLVEAQIERSRLTLSLKAEEYAKNDDRLHNFKQAADLQGVSIREALSGFMAKDTVAIYDMLQDGEDHPMDEWEKKITGHINYLLLLDAVIKEEDLERKGLNNGPEKLKVETAAEIEGSDEVEANVPGYKPVAARNPSELVTITSD